MGGALARLDVADGVATVTLNRPGRHNALVPDLLENLRAAIAAADRPDVFCLVLTGAGRSFSTGGDIAGFREAAETPGGIGAYAERIVGLLNGAILDLLAFPVPVVARVNGAATGGAVGLVLASDIVVMSTDAFLQSYYVEVGFSPDGGWTALLPERIGPQRAVAVQALNERIGAARAMDLGLATQVVPPDALDGAVAEIVGTLRGKERQSLVATRRLVWDEARRGEVATRLAAERTAFVGLVERAEVARRMEGFAARR